MIRRLAVALTLVAMGIPMPVAAAPVQSAGWYEGACVDNVGITVVVDFQELGGGVNVRCAPGPVSSGLDALDKAGISWESARRFPGVVCRIAGKPGTDVEPCSNTPPLSAYWSYWIAPRGGEWCYASIGAGNRTPAPGTIEGWSFALGRTSSDTPPPGFQPPSPINGQAPSPLRGSDCGAPSNAPPPTTTVLAAAPSPSTVPQPPAPAPTEPPVVQVTSEASVAPATTGTIAPVVGAAALSTTTTASSIAGTSIASTSVNSSTTTSVNSSTTTSVNSSTTTSTTEVSDLIGTDDTEAVGGTAPSGAGPDSTAALGTVDLGDDGRDSGGFGAATAIGVAAAGSLIAAGVWAARRRRVLP